jgi:cytochrome c peroxidase
MSGRAAALALALTALGASPTIAQDAPFEPAEIRRILTHGPWPLPPPRDPSNRVSGDPAAIALGQRLFFDARLSAGGVLACASCHEPTRAWTDGRERAIGLSPLDRNTPTVLDVARHRWFSWDGRADNLWSQSAKPIVDAREMGASARHAARLVATDPALACLYSRAFGRPVTAAASDEEALADVGKALAAFVERLGTGRSAFDELREALAQADAAAAARYPPSARRGLRIFMGKGNCRLCHVGPAFTDGEFHDVGVPYLVAPGRVDAGRYAGLGILRADRLNLLGPYNDDRSDASAIKTRHVERQQANWGQFKTPSLRNVALTAPYMHDGRYPRLRDVVRHYSELDMERIHAHGEQLLRPLRLSDAESDDLVAFLETLTAPGATDAPRPPRRIEGCDD